jgi:lipopolysaccharide export system permease protein
MINHIQKDLLKKHVGPFLFCFFTVMFILLMQFLILHVDKLVGKGLPFLIVVELILNNLAYMVVLAVPMAVLVATLMAFGRFSEWNELTALKAAGVNPFSLMKPVLVIAYILFVGLNYFSNEILPESNHKARSLFIDIRMHNPGFDLQPGVFYDGIEGYTFLVRDIPAASDTLYDVTLFQEEERGRYRAYIKAEKGWLVSPDEYTLSLFLEDGTLIRYIPGERRGGSRQQLDPAGRGGRPDRRRGLPLRRRLPVPRRGRAGRGLRPRRARPCRCPDDPDRLRRRLDRHDRLHRPR